MKLHPAAESERYVAKRRVCAHSGMCCHVVKYSRRVLYAFALRVTCIRAACYMRSHRVLYAPASCAQIRAHDAEGIFFEPGNLCLGNPDQLGNLHLRFSLEKAQGNDLMFPGIEFF